MTTIKTAENLHDEVRKRGLLLAVFLAEEPVFNTRTLLEEYLALRNVRRYRVTELLGLGGIRVELPPHKLQVLQDVAARRPIGVAWLTAELPWWYPWRRWLVWHSTVVH